MNVEIKKVLVVKGHKGVDVDMIFIYTDLPHPEYGEEGTANFGTAIPKALTSKYCEENFAGVEVDVVNFNQINVSV